MESKGYHILDPNQQVEEDLGLDFNPGIWGYTVIPVLDFLKGLPYDDFAKAWIYALRPSKVRVTQGEVQCNACVWRVTVFLDGDKIDRIEQEVEIGLAEDACHGHDMGVKLKERTGNV